MFDIPVAEDEVSGNEDRPLVMLTSEFAFELSSINTRSEPSRALTLYDGSIDPTDACLLQRVYCETPCDTYTEAVWLRLIQKFVYIHGPSISHPSLRQAILLYCRPLWSETSSFEDIERQRQRARHALRLKLNQLSKVDEGDLFAAFFIAFHFLRAETIRKGQSTCLGSFLYCNIFLVLAHPLTITMR